MKNLNEPDYQKITTTIFLVAIILLAWQMFVEAPRREKLAKHYSVTQKQKSEIKEKKAEEIIAKGIDSDYNPKLTREQRLAASERIAINSDKLHGSISLTGARFDDLTLAKYKVEQKQGSPDVTLLTPNGDATAYFAQAGWVAIDGKTKVPDGKSVWQTDKKNLNANESTTISWDNGEGVTFILSFHLDSDYMFTINQKVENKSGNAISVAPFGYINRAHIEPPTPNAILHEGPMGVMDGVINEMGYKNLREKGNITFDNMSGWVGITDKYWLTALIPDSKKYKATFSHYTKNEQERYQVDYIGETQNISANMGDESKLRLFAGAKEIHILDRYATGDDKNQPITLFDRAVDFGMLYFLTKPLFLILTFFYEHIGNFGLAIMAVTVLVKLCMYQLANKSYKATAKMRVLQPEMVKLRERYHDDHIALNKEVMAMYKKHGVNPAAGCLPLLIQMPVFFALYKVLYVTIEMRHAPFFGWLTDLSAADPSNIFTLFGLLQWNHPNFLHLGILPILYTITMIIQMKQNPPPTDPIQAKVMNFMPYFLLVIFASFPAGLVLYWVWSNILSIIQQEIITLRHGSHRSQLAKANKKQA